MNNLAFVKQQDKVNSGLNPGDQVCFSYSHRNTDLSLTVFMSICCKVSETFGVIGTLNALIF